MKNYVEKENTLEKIVYRLRYCKGERKMERRKHRIGLVNIILIGLYIAGVVLLFVYNKRDMDLYQAHEWVTVEAVYKRSNSYTVTTYDEDGDEDEEEIRYEWYYEYKINGKVYECRVKDNIEEEPYGGQDTRTIMAATDDNSVYLLYENEEELKNSHNYKKRLSMFIWGIVGLVLILYMFIIKKASKAMIRRRHR